MSRPHWRCVYLALGSNLDGPIHQLKAAVGALRQLAALRLYRVSSLVTSAPADGSEQPWYVNGVVAGMTRLDGPELLRQCRAIERAQGRDPQAPRWSARTLDIDIIALGDQVSDDAHLTLPHPRAKERVFVLQPLAEVAPHAVLPGLGRAEALLAALGQPPLSRVPRRGDGELA